MAIQSFLNENVYDKMEDKHLKLSTLLDSNVVGIFLNAFWSKPGQKFANELNNVYIEANKRKLKFKLVYVSYDKDEETYQEYFEDKFDKSWILWPFDSITKG